MTSPGAAEVAAPEPVAGQSLTDEELAAMALAADQDTAVGDDAVSLWDVIGQTGGPLLPEWYMPSPMGRLRRPWQRWIVLLIIVSFLVIDAYGLCSTYGQVVRA